MPNERLSPSAQRDLLEKILLRCSTTGRHSPPPVVVFDLDGTLMDNRPRSLKILNELADSWQTREPELSAKLRGFREDDLKYLFGESLTKFGVKPELVAEGEAFWKDRFFQDAHLVHDVAIAGSVQFAHDLYAARATLVYLTGRDLPNM
ncbi:MAG: haloacid dehalogenase-like hydrolase, partial [Polyangiaceae bacterium]